MKPNSPDLADKFRAFAKDPTVQASSPLYTFLAAKIADDPLILELAQSIHPSQPPANVLLGAVHLLLRRQQEENPDHLPPLARYYASLTPRKALSLPDEEAFKAFKAYVLAKSNSLLFELKNRRVATNVVRRCCYLYPALKWISERAGHPLALIELGCSAGFNLLPDRYGYRYRDEASNEVAFRPAPKPREPASSTRTPWVEPEALTLDARLVGPGRPEIGAPSPQIRRRIGIDLLLQDVNDSDHMQWLAALIWPEEFETRLKLLESAAHNVSAYRKELHFRQGDANDLLEVLLPDIPEDAVPVIYHTHMANQLNDDELDRLEAILKEASKGRVLIHLANNLRGDPSLRCQFIEDEKVTEYTVARVDGHGYWLEWLL